MATTTSTAVEQVIEAYGDKLRASDVGGVVDLFTDDGVAREPGQATAVGRQQLQAAYQRIGDELHIDVTFAFDGTLIDGDLAVVRTRATGTLTITPTGAVVPVEAREFFALRRVDSVWKIAVYMFQEMAAQ